MNIRDHPFLYQWDTNRYEKALTEIEAALGVSG